MLPNSGEPSSTAFLPRRKESKRRPQPKDLTRPGEGQKENTMHYEIFNPETRTDADGPIPEDLLLDVNFTGINHEDHWKSGFIIQPENSHPFLEVCQGGNPEQPDGVRVVIREPVWIRPY